MNRMKYYDYIDERLNSHSLRVRRSGKLNHLSLNVHSENFYYLFLNLLYGWKLSNLNDKLQNVEAIDLIDHENKLVVQVSAINTKDKIEKSLEKKSMADFSGYTFKYVLISDKDADSLRRSTFNNPHKLIFNPHDDIVDVVSLLGLIKSKDAVAMRVVYQFVKSELGNEVDIAKLESNLATMINILSKENLDVGEDLNINSFEIDRKISFNHLDSAKDIVSDYSAHHSRVDKIYNTFDLQGKNKSTSVLSKIRSIYIKNQANKTDDELFFYIVDEIVKIVSDSANYIEIPIDELELCANVLAVDAFVRCKIFKNPSKYNYVTA